jgi:hypothetical protein
MYLGFALAYLAAFSLASSSATRKHANDLAGRQDAPATAAIFHITDYLVGCSPGGCVNSYNVTTPQGYVAGAPAFNVSCVAILGRYDWHECTPNSPSQLNSTVASNYDAGSAYELTRLWVSHQFRDGSKMWNVTAYAEVARFQENRTYDLPVVSQQVISSWM